MASEESTIDQDDVCIILNRDSPVNGLGPSESFLQAHIDGLSKLSLAVLGNPGFRRADSGRGAFLGSRSLVLLGFRWLIRRAGLSDIAAQDAMALARFLKKHRIRVALAEYGLTGLGAAEGCARAKVPLVVHFHGWDAYVLASASQHREAYNRLFHASTAIIAVSRHMRDHLISLGAPPNRTIWNPCGASVSLSPGEPARVPPRFVSIGRSAPKKAAVVLLLAFAEVRRALPEATLELIGDHTRDPAIPQLVQALRLEGNVTFHGPKPHDEVLAILRKARCYVHPSVTAPDGDMEGTPVSVLEAMAAGVPVVSTRHGGILDVLGTDGGGVLVDEFDVEATAKAMVEYGESPSKARVDGEAGYRAVSERWSLDRSISRLSLVLNAAASRDTALLAEYAERMPL